MSNLLDQITLCTYSSGSVMVREVLDDWVEFLGGRPAQINFAVAASAGVVPPVYEELQAEGKIDRIIPLEAAGRSPEIMNAESVYEAVRSATTEWVILIKLDTLPYRSGHDNWLAEAMLAIEQERFLGMTASFLYNEAVASIPGYKAIQKTSENFALMRRTDWLAALQAAIGPAGYGSEISRSERFQGINSRYINEHIIEEWMIAQNRWMLQKFESPEWTIFHVNVWGDRLRLVRESYRARRGIKPFLNLEAPANNRAFHPWEFLYGTERPPLLRRIRIAIGSWRRQSTGKTTGPQEAKMLPIPTRG